MMGVIMILTLEWYAVSIAITLHNTIIQTTVHLARQNPLELPELCSSNIITDTHEITTSYPDSTTDCSNSSAAMLQSITNSGTGVTTVGLDSDSSPTICTAVDKINSAIVAVLGAVSAILLLSMVGMAIAWMWYCHRNNRNQRCAISVSSKWALLHGSDQDTDKAVPNKWLV